MFSVSIIYKNVRKGFGEPPKIADFDKDYEETSLGNTAWGRFIQDVDRQLLPESQGGTLIFIQEVCIVQEKQDYGNYEYSVIDDAFLSMVRNSRGGELTGIVSVRLLDFTENNATTILEHLMSMSSRHGNPYKESQIIFATTQGDVDVHGNPTTERKENYTLAKENLAESINSSLEKIDKKAKKEYDAKINPRIAEQIFLDTLASMRGTVSTFKQIPKKITTELFRRLHRDFAAVFDQLNSVDLDDIKGTSVPLFADSNKWFIDTKRRSFEKTPTRTLEKDIERVARKTPYTDDIMEALVRQYAHIKEKQDIQATMFLELYDNGEDLDKRKDILRMQLEREKIYLRFAGWLRKYGALEKYIFEEEYIPLRNRLLDMVSLDEKKTDDERSRMLNELEIWFPKSDVRYKFFVETRDVVLIAIAELEANMAIMSIIMSSLRSLIRINNEIVGAYGEGVGYFRTSPDRYAPTQAITQDNINEIKFSAAAAKETLDAYLTDNASDAPTSEDDDEFEKLFTDIVNATE